MCRPVASQAEVGGSADEAAAEVVGPSGHVVAADISPAMVERARERLDAARNG